MGVYSTTLNIPLPDAATQLKAVRFEGNAEYDWTATPYCHCTLKSIAIGEQPPLQEEIREWIAAVDPVLDRTEPFAITLEGVGVFPNTLYAKVHSDRLHELHKRIFPLLPSGQPQFENEGYTPHVSIRVLRAPVTVTSDANASFGTYPVDEVQLITWNRDDRSKSVIHRTFALRR